MFRLSGALGARVFLLQGLGFGVCLFGSNRIRCFLMSAWSGGIPKTHVAHFEGAVCFIGHSSAGSRLV